MQVRRPGGKGLKLWNNLKRLVGLQVEERCSGVIQSGSLGSRSPPPFPAVTHATPPGPQPGGTEVIRASCVCRAPLFQLGLLISRAYALPQRA